MSLSIVCLSGCCLVRPPLQHPDWLTPEVEYPTAHACSQFEHQIQHQMYILKDKLESEHLCCQGDQACLDQLRKEGTLAWDRALQTYDIVHTNLPSADKIDALLADQISIERLNVCRAH